MIFSFFRKFLGDSYRLAGHTAYAQLVEKARAPHIYTELGVEDTLDGRFEAIVLHIFMLTNQLKDKNPRLLRAVWEAFFYDMDRSLREMGASDTGIGKRIKKMVQAFYGRIEVYEASFASDTQLAASLQRNLYRGKEVPPQQMEKLVEYVRSTVANILEYLNIQEEK